MINRFIELFFELFTTVIKIGVAATIVMIVGIIITLLLIRIF